MLLCYLVGLLAFLVLDNLQATRSLTLVSRKCARVCYVLAHAAKHASTQCVCKLHPDFEGGQLVQNFATYTRINTVFT